MNDDYHTKPITQTAHLPPLNIALSVSLDGSARVWDGETNMLIRELNFGEPLTSATFINNRGDFVLGMRDSVFLVKGKDYLPLSKQARLYARQDVRDQAIEEPLMFDPILSIWALMKHEEMNEVVQTQPVDEPKETPASPVKSILCSDGLRQRMLTYMQNRLIAAHARNERRAFDLARMYEPIMRFSHLANSGVDWAYFLPHYKAFCPDAVIDAAMPAEVLYREKAQLFNNAVRLESAKDVLQFIGDHFLQELRSQDQWTAQERELAIMDSEMTTIMQDIDNVAAPTLEDVCVLEEGEKAYCLLTNRYHSIHARSLRKCRSSRTQILLKFTATEKR